jgi:hypothetical protein
VLVTIQARIFNGSKMLPCLSVQEHGDLVGFGIELADVRILSLLGLVGLVTRVQGLVEGLLSLREVLGIEVDSGVTLQVQERKTGHLCSSLVLREKKGSALLTMATTDHVRSLPVQIDRPL